VLRVTKIMVIKMNSSDGDDNDDDVHVVHVVLASSPPPRERIPRITVRSSSSSDSEDLGYHIVIPPPSLLSQIEDELIGLVRRHASDTERELRVVRDAMSSIDMALNLPDWFLQGHESPPNLSYSQLPLAILPPEPTSSDINEKEIDEDEDACGACCKEKANVIAYPCCHVYFCSSCVRKNVEGGMSQSKKCPTCREPVQKYGIVTWCM